MTQDFATRLTGMALILSSLFKVKFHDTLVTGRSPILSEPAGPSSAGGQLSVQRISLEQKGRPTIIIGWANCATSECELRTWAYLEQVHRRRYPNQRLPVAKYEYVDFLAELKKFMEDRHLEVTIKDAKPDVAVAPSIRPTRHRKTKTRMPWTLLLALGFIVALAAEIYFFYLR
jgi:hypothetical protein